MKHCKGIFINPTYTRDTTAPEISHTCNHLVHNLRRIRPHTERHLEVVGLALRRFTRDAFQRDIQSSIVAHLFQLTRHALFASELRVV